MKIIIISNYFWITLNCRCLTGCWIWFWIYKGSVYHRITQVSKYAWVIPEYAMPEYAGICVNVPKSIWTTFILHISIAIPCLFECVVTYFSVYMKLEVLAWRNTRLFSWRGKIWFSWQLLEVSDILFILDLLLLQVRFQIGCYLSGPRWVGAANLDITKCWILKFPLRTCLA